MSDCCTLELELRADAVDKFCAVTGVCNPDDFETNGGVAYITTDAANHAWLSELVQAAIAGIAFTGSNGPGEEYGAGRFAGYGGKYREVPVLNGDIVVCVNEKTGDATASALKDVRRYLAMREKAIAAITRKGPPKAARKRKAKTHGRA